MENYEVARILREIALFLEMDDIQFKPRAYERAAMSIEALDEGRVANEIVKRAKNGQFDLIILGSRGLGRVRRFLGSLSSRVTYLAHCPVLVVK